MAKEHSGPRGVLFDIDGTLIDSNDAHALAWVQALEEAGHQVPFERVRRLIGMGGDKLLPELTGLARDNPAAETIGKRRQAIFKKEYLPRLRPFPQARELVQYLRDRGLRSAVASSAEPEELRGLLEAAGVADLLSPGKGADVSKPDPDLVQAALSRIGCRPQEAVLVGDTPYDIEAARRAGVRSIAVRCGGWQDGDLSGADAIFDDPAELLRRWDEVAR